MVAYPTKTKIELGQGELVIKEGSAAKLETHLSGVIPKTAKLDLQTGKGRPREIELEVTNGVSTYELASASRDFTYRVKAGDARSDWRQVRVIPAPRLAEVKVGLEFPAYIERPTETAEALTLTVPEETKVRWQLTLDTPRARKNSTGTIARKSPICRSATQFPSLSRWRTNIPARVERIAPAPIRAASLSFPVRNISRRSPSKWNAC